MTNGIEMIVEILNYIKVTNLKAKKYYCSVKCCQMHADLTVPD